MCVCVYAVKAAIITSEVDITNIKCLRLPSSFRTSHHLHWIPLLHTCKVQHTCEYDVSRRAGTQNLDTQHTYHAQTNKSMFETAYACRSTWRTSWSPVESLQGGHGVCAVCVFVGVQCVFSCVCSVCFPACAVLPLCVCGVCICACAVFVFLLVQCVPSYMCSVCFRACAYACACVCTYFCVPSVRELIFCLVVDGNSCVRKLVSRNPLQRRLSQLYIKPGHSHPFLLSMPGWS